MARIRVEAIDAQGLASSQDVTIAVQAPLPQGRPWSQLHTWHDLGFSGFPTRTTAVTIPAGFPLVYDVDDAECGAIVNRGLLIAARGAARRLRLYGNIELRGEGTLSAGSPTEPHADDLLLQWVNVDESRFVGGGMDPLPTDHGLWVMDRGHLALYGAPVRSWGWLQAGVDGNIDTIVLAQDPIGWRVGGEVVIAPTRPPFQARPPRPEDNGIEADWEGVDRIPIRSISGRTIRLERPLQFPHPAKTLRADGRVFTAEVAYLGRTVRFEGLPNRRMHVFIRSAVPQQAHYVSVRYFGPRRPTPEYPESTTKVLGRYGWHAHHCMDGSRGSVFRGLALFDGGNHGAVPHMSHGTSWPECVVFNAMEGLFWWDEPVTVDPPWPVPSTDPRSNASHDTVWDDCLGMLMRLDFRGSPAGQVGIFLMGAGNNNRARRCRAVGAAPGSQVGGFHWPDDAADVRLVFGIGNVWDPFDDCVAHNCGASGITNWQNDTEPHVLTRPVCYHNGIAGGDHGAYANNYRWVEGVFEDNGEYAIMNHALGHNPGRPGQPQTPHPLVYERCYFGAGLVDRRYAFRFVEHTVASERRMQIRDCVFDGYTRAAIVDDPDQATAEATIADVVRPQLRGSGQAFWLGERAHVGFDVRCQPDPRSGTGAVQIRHSSASRGTPYAPWNARVESIPPFA